MTGQVFYRKWRPQTLAEIVGQEHVTQTLYNALATQRVAHAYLFYGPRGTGKTSTGRILAKAVNCLTNGRGEPCNECSLCQAMTDARALDLVEIDAASNRGIDEIRDLREKVNFAPSQARYKVYIIDEVHMLTEPAFNALLKTLEEPPPHIIFVLATTEVHKVPPTILSRCQRFDFHRIPRSAIVKRLSQICEREGIEAEPQALGLIARSVTGSMRDAENLLEQLVTYHGGHIDLQQAQSILGITGDLRTRELARNILNKAVAAGLATINQVSRDGVDLRQFNRELVDYLRGALLVKAGAQQTVDLPPELISELSDLVAEVPMQQILKAVRLFGQADLGFDAQSTLGLELALVECGLPGAREEPYPQATGTALETAPVEPAVAAQRAEPSVPEEAAEMPRVSPEVERFRSHWNEVVEALRGAGSKGNLDAFLRSACEPVAVEGDTIVLGFYYRFHKEKIEDPKYRHLVEQKVSEVFQAPYQVRCILTPRRKSSHLVEAAVEMGAKIIDAGEEE